VTFGYAIDAVGGVPIYVYETIDNRNRAGLPAIPLYGYFEVGSHWLSGEEAVRYARIRSIGGIFGRHDRQNEVLAQLYSRVMDPSVISKIPELIDAFYGRVMTDLSLDQVSQLACLGLMLDWEDIQFEGFSEDMFVEGYNEWGYTVLFAGPNVVRDRIAEFLQD
jgi:anionic cell wall polymer biosynthesis LytR-Cps2A-Psr (LCP) family protein